MTDRATELISELAQHQSWLQETNSRAGAVRPPARPASRGRFSDLCHGSFLPLALVLLSLAAIFAAIAWRD
jgi:hypothetical protein